MFPLSFFPNRYFTTEYFPKARAALTSPFSLYSFASLTSLGRLIADGTSNLYSGAGSSTGGHSVLVGISYLGIHSLDISFGRTIYRSSLVLLDYCDVALNDHSLFLGMAPILSFAQLADINVPFAQLANDTQVFMQIS